MTFMNPSSGIRTVLTQVPSIILNNQGIMSPQFELIKEKHYLGRGGPKVDFNLPESWGIISRTQAYFCRQGNDYYIYDGDGVNPSTNRLFINHKMLSPKEGYLLQDGMEIKIGQDPATWIIITYSNPNQLGVPKTPEKSVISLLNQSVMIGRDPTANLQLDSPIVSRRHAVIDRNNQGQYLIYDYSTNGVFINGQKVVGSALLVPGAIIRIGSYILVLRGDELILADRGDNIRLDAKNLLCIAQDKQGQPIRLLNNISFPIDPGQFVAIVGGSGSGKSTLLRTLLGINPLIKGTVELNGENLRNHFNIYRNLIGYVPQNDIVHENLTVKEVLYYTAKRILSSDINTEEIIERTVKQVELSDRLDTLVKDLSGGQKKRVSIGVELLADPKLFLLDEPTSGLDPGLDKKMMQLLRNLANQGRTIILVTHATLNINLCDRVIFLGKGGNLCYFGTPQQVSQFFNLVNNDFADIYLQLETLESVEQARAKFEQSQEKKHYIDDRLYNQSFNPNLSQPQQPYQQVKRSFWRQFSILSQRYFKLIIRDPINLSLSLLTAPLGIILIDLAIADKNPLIKPIENSSSAAPLALKVLFVFTCAAIWVGLASSLQEIIKEDKIYQRERLVNLGLVAYLGSKLAILGGLAFIQSFLISLTILMLFQSPNSLMIPWFLGLEITIFLTLFTTISLGIMASACVKNTTQANSSLPILLLPQIIFSGILFKMEGMGKIISWLMISRWSVGALGALVNIEEMVPTVSPLNPVSVDIPLEVYQTNWNNLALNWGILLLQSLISWGITFIVQKRKDII